MKGPLLRVVVGVMLLALAGCGGLPREGPIQSGPSREPGAELEAAVDYTPEGPRRGAVPLDVVGGFLQAMQATPLSTAVAREFLTDEASTEWVPEKATVVYGVYALEGRGARIRLELSETAKLDSRGEWLGDTSEGRGLSHRLRLVRERGQWRISNPPDSLIIAQAYFQTRFTQHFLHFFDRSAQVLVPEPVYVPVGEQAPTLLVRGLLRGPEPPLSEVIRTFIPARTQLDDLSVLVSDDGLAQVPLTENIAEVDAETLDLALAQIGWTLGQVPGVRKFQVTVDGSPLQLPGQGTNHDVTAWPEFDPSVAWASPDLFGIRDSRVVAVSDGGSERLLGVTGAKDFDARAVALDLPARRVAGVSGDGSSVLVAPRDRAGAAVRDPAGPIVSGAEDLLQPAWDIHGQLWLLDQTPDGAALSVLSEDTTKVAAPGITGRDVEAFELSRDGTRLVAVVERGRRDRLVVARVVRRDDGSVRGVTPAQQLPLAGSAVKEIQDVAWRTPGSVMVLTQPTQGSSQVSLALVDGSTATGDLVPDAGILPQQPVRLVASPTPGTPVLVETARRRIYELSEGDGWSRSAIEPGLASVTYVG
ncbi:MAG: Sporulation and spore germination protein [uncultured Nocardioidaceae bacterium]|uniref:Sporulation and spore germination protein n=1 Tax=uncultured Nocardioidaceae bacterium TaxID=253824 RepID=A0A6J4MAS1_9ACTN|nr:MAG: Sporulation and spore germination protein [uncultured Nocardioidaceae bacterium]